MTLQELQQIKDSLDKGVIVSKAVWLRVLEHAIKREQEEVEYQEWVRESLPLQEEG